MSDFTMTKAETVCLICYTYFITERRYLLRNQGHYCSRSCASKAPRRRPSHKGVDNPNWKGGVSQNAYRYKLRQKRQHPERIAARVAVYQAIRSGKLIRQSCSVCGVFPADAHHENYSKPLDVIWLCDSCHKQHHKKKSQPGQI